MNKLIAIRIKNNNGTYSDEIPINTFAEYVSWDNSHSLVDILGNIDLSKGTVQAQLNDKLDDGELANYVQEQISSDVTSWLNTYVSPAGSAVVVDTSLTVSGAAADAKKTGDELAELNGRLDTEGLSENVKSAFLDCFAHVAWVDEHWQDYYDALYAALYGGSPTPSFDYGVYEPDTIVNGKYIDENGDVQTGTAGTSFYIEDYIPVIRSNYWIGMNPSSLRVTTTYPQDPILVNESDWRVSEYDASK